MTNATTVIVAVVAAALLSGAIFVAAAPPSSPSSSSSSSLVVSRQVNAETANPAEFVSGRQGVVPPPETAIGEKKRADGDELPEASTKKCEADPDCGPNSRCDAGTGSCSCAEGTVPAEGSGTAGCVKKVLGIGDACRTDDECRSSNPALVCMAAEKKCRCNRAYAVEDAACVQRTEPAKALEVVDGGKRLEEIFGFVPSSNGRAVAVGARYVNNDNNGGVADDGATAAQQPFDPEFMADNRHRRRRLQLQQTSASSSSSTSPHVPDPTVTAVVVVAFTVLFTGLCVAAYVKCKQMARANRDGGDGGDGGAVSRYAPSSSMSTSSSSHHTADTPPRNNCSSASATMSGSATADSLAGLLARRLKSWSVLGGGGGGGAGGRHDKEPRLTISVLGQIYEKEWAMHRGAASAASNQFAHKEFDSASSTCQDDDDDDGGDDDDVRNEKKDVYLPPEIAYYISDQAPKPDELRQMTLENENACCWETATERRREETPPTPPPTAVTVLREPEEINSDDVPC